MSSNQKTRSPSGQAHKQKVVRGQNLSHRQVAINNTGQPATNVTQKQAVTSKHHQQQYAEGWFSPSGASGQIVVTSAPKRIFPSQTGSNSFTSTQIINKKLFREDNSADAQYNQASDAQWASTLDNPGIQHRTTGDSNSNQLAASMVQASNQATESNPQTAQQHKHRKMQNIQTTNFGVTSTTQAAPTTFNLSPMAAVSSSTVAGSTNPNTFQFDLQQQQVFHQAQMNKLGAAQSQANSGLNSTTSHNQQFLAQAVMHESSTPHAAFSQTQQINHLGQYQPHPVMQADGTVTLNDQSSGGTTKADSNAQSVPSSKIKKRLVSKSGGQRKANLQQISYQNQQVSNGQGNGALRLIQTRQVDRQTKADTISQEQVVEVNRNQIASIRRQQKQIGQQQQERQPSYSQNAVQQQHGLRVGLARSAQPPQQPFEQMNFTAQLNGISSLTATTVQDTTDKDFEHNTSTGKKTSEGQRTGQNKVATLGVDKREKSSRKPATTSTGPKSRQPAGTSSSQHPKAVLLKQSDTRSGGAGVKMQRIQAFARSDFNSTMRVPVSTKNASSNKKTFLAVATSNAAESIAAAQNRYQYQVNQESGLMTGMPSEVTTVTPMHHSTAAQNSANGQKVGLRQNLNQPKIIPSQRAQGGSTSQQPQRKPSIQPESNASELQKQLVLLQSGTDESSMAGILHDATSQSQTSKHTNQKQQFISISHVSNKSTAPASQAYDQSQTHKVKLAPSSSKALKQKSSLNPAQNQQLMQIRLVPENGSTQDTQVINQAAQDASAFGMFMAAKANAFTSSQTSGSAGVQKLESGQAPEYSKKAAQAIKPKSQERAVSNSQLNQPGGTQNYMINKQSFLLNNVTSVSGQPQRLQQSQQAQAMGTRLEGNQPQHQHHVIASSTTNKIKKSFNFEVEPTKNGPGNKSTTNQQANKGQNLNLKNSQNAQQMTVTNVQQVATGKSRQQKTGQSVNQVAPATSGSSNQTREKRASQASGNQQKYQLLQSNSLSNSRKVLKMTDQILKGLVVNSTTAANTSKVQQQVAAAVQGSTTNAQGQLMHKKVKIVAAKATSQSKPPAHAQYFDQVGANSTAPPGPPAKNFSLQHQMQQQANLQNQKQLFAGQSKLKGSANPSSNASASQSQTTGNTVININIDNRGGSTSSYSHLLPGHLNVPSITVNTQLQEEQRRSQGQRGSTTEQSAADNITKGTMRTPVSGQQVAGGQPTHKKNPMVSSSGSGNAGSKKQTRVGSKDNHPVNNPSSDALFSPKGITIAAGSGKALPSSTRARHPKTFVFKQDKQSSSGSRIRDDSSLITRQAAKYDNHEEGSSNTRRRKNMDSNSKVVPHMNQEDTMAILSKLFQKTGQPSFAMNPTNNLKTTKRKSIEKGSQPAPKTSQHQTDMPSARQRGGAIPSGGKVADFDDMVIEFESQMAAANRGGKPAKKSSKAKQQMQDTEAHARMSELQQQISDSGKRQEQLMKKVGGTRQDPSECTQGSDVQEYDLDVEERRVAIPTNMNVSEATSANHKRLNTFAQHPNSSTTQPVSTKGKQNKDVGKAEQAKGTRNNNYQQATAQLEHLENNMGFNQTQPLAGIGAFNFPTNTSPLSKKLQGGSFLNQQQQQIESTKNANQYDNLVASQVAAYNQQKTASATAYMSLVSSINNAPKANRQPIIFDEQVAEQEAAMRKDQQQLAQKPQLVNNQFFYENSNSQAPDESSLNQITKHRTDPEASHNLSIDSASKVHQESPKASSSSPSKKRKGTKKGHQTMVSEGSTQNAHKVGMEFGKGQKSNSEAIDVTAGVAVDSFESTPKKGGSKSSASFNNQNQKPVPAKIEELANPIKGSLALKTYAKTGMLTDYEKLELMDYQEVYYIGVKCAAEKIKGRPGKKYNDGYDDDNGDYTVVLHDHIGFRFEVLDFLGKGSFGQALKCIDHLTNEIVAIKIIRNKKKFQHQAGVELKILQHLQDNDPDDRCNIIQIKAHMMFRQHLIISFELFSINLYEFIKNNNFQGFSLSLIRRFAIQILQALKYLREQNVIHCDLKPENILLKSPEKSGIKIIDFGSSCFSDERIYTYIQSRFYRAPEIVLGIPYTTAIDMWSFGCILTELYTGIPIFPGESEHEQLSLIMQVVGLPPEYLLMQATRKANFFQEDSNQPLYGCEDSTGNLRVPNTRPLLDIIGAQSDSFLDFITQCLEWDPEQRITPFQALLHPWIIEGLPAQVLVHHQRMLGIDVPSSHSTTPACEDETCATSYAAQQIEQPSSNAGEQSRSGLLRRDPQEIINDEEQSVDDSQFNHAGQGHGQMQQTASVDSGHLAQMIRTQPVPQQFFQGVSGHQFYPPAPSTNTNDNDYETATELDQRGRTQARHSPQTEAQQQSINENARLMHKYHPTHQNAEESDSNSAGAKKKSQTSNVADILHKLNNHLSKHAHQPPQNNQHPNQSQIKHLNW